MNEERYLQLVEYLRSARRGEASYPTRFTANEKRGLRQQAASFKERDGVLFYRSDDAHSSLLRRVVPAQSEQERLIRACHDGVDGGHFGRDKTLSKVRELNTSNNSSLRVCYLASPFLFFNLAVSIVLVEGHGWRCRTIL